MGCTLLTACVHLCMLFFGILVHLVATLIGYVDIIIFTVESDCVS